MKPRRTFESVVSELAEGLRSGQILLHEECPQKMPPATLSGAPQETKRQSNNESSWHGGGTQIRIPRP
jgi:hypothetical protein